MAQAIFELAKQKRATETQQNVKESKQTAQISKLLASFKNGQLSSQGFSEDSNFINVQTPEENRALLHKNHGEKAKNGHLLILGSNLHLQDQYKILSLSQQETVNFINCFKSQRWTFEGIEHLNQCSIDNGRLYLDSLYDKLANQLSPVRIKKLDFTEFSTNQIPPNLSGISAVTFDNQTLRINQTRFAQWFSMESERTYHLQQIEFYQNIFFALRDFQTCRENYTGITRALDTLLQANQSHAAQGVVIEKTLELRPTVLNLHWYSPSYSNFRIGASCNPLNSDLSFGIGKAYFHTLKNFGQTPIGVVTGAKIGPKFNFSSGSQSYKGFGLNIFFGVGVCL
jgi:hypothetical protein